MNFDVIRNDQDEKQTAGSVFRGFRLLRKQNWFKRWCGNKDLIVWMDCGKP